jgi:hypothetical protein
MMNSTFYEFITIDSIGLIPWYHQPLNREPWNSEPVNAAYYR